MIYRMKLQQIPLMRRVDVVIFGAGTAAVSAARAARQAGNAVLVLSDRAYLGEESAGALEVMEETRHGEFPGSGIEPGRPGTVKHALEMALLEAGVDFLFMARPVALLPGQEGVIHVVIASRTSLLAVSTGQVLDASTHGLLRSLPGVERFTARPRRALKRTAASAILFGNLACPPKLDGVRLTPVGRTILFTDRVKRDRMEVQAFRAQSEVEPCALTPEGAKAEAEFRARLLHPGVELLADAVRWKLTNTAEENVGLYDDPLVLTAAQYAVHPQLWICGPELPLSDAGLATLHDSAILAALGRRLAELMAAEARRPGAVNGTERDKVMPGFGKIRFVPSFLRETVEMLELELPEFPLLDQFDVVVAGGGTGGAPAGIAAARSGKRTLVLEQQRMLGGVGTAGTIGSYWFGNKVGFTAEVDSFLHSTDPTYVDPERKRPLATWNTELKAAWYLSQLQAAGGEVWLGSFAFGVEMDGDFVVGVLVSTPFGAGLVRCRSVVDASGNADIAAAAGAPLRVMDALHSAVQGAGLSPRRVGAHYVNTDFTFIDDNDPYGITYAYVQARAKFPEEFDSTTILNTRERRQIIGRIELSPLDFLAGRTFPDVINTASSNFDTHGFTTHPVFAVVAPDHAPLSANVPLRCLMPQRVRGVIVTGLGMSAHRDSLPVIRMQADVQNQGYAAGLAAAMATDCGGDFDAVNVRVLQRELVARQALAPEALEWEDSFPLPREEVVRSAAITPVTLFSAAILFAHPEESVPLLRAAMQQPASDLQYEEAALMLGLMADASAAFGLAELIAARPWDEGWNYRGMGQFGMSASRTDALIVALGRTRSVEAIPVLLEKMAALGSDAAFSHCRAVALAAGSLGASEYVPALQRLLSLPGMQGHAIVSFGDGVQAANGDPVETASRNNSLRELYLAKGLYLCGDCDGTGRRILEGYSRDLRGPFARHARAVLSASDFELLRRKSI